MKSLAAFRLPRTLGHAEVWAFGISGLLLWTLAAGDVIVDIGVYWALPVWVAVTAVGIVGNLQIKRLAENWPEMSGGTPNYTARLLTARPWLARYAAMAYFQGWASVPTLSGILLSDLIVGLFLKWGIVVPALPLYVLLTSLSFIIAFSGTRTLSLLVLFLAIPAMGGLLAFVVSGLAWGATAATAVIALPPAEAWSLPAWAKWYLICTYAAYSVETASSFFADSRDAGRARSVLSSVVWLMPVVFIGGSVVLALALPDRAVPGESGVLGIIRAAQAFWGEAAWFAGTFVIAAAALLSCATGAANSPRVLYQLALDGKAATVFGVSSDRGVLGPALVMTTATSLVFLVWQGYTAVFVVTGVGWFASFILLRLGIWLNRRESYARWPRLSLALLVAEAGILLVGGWSWGAGLFAAGLVLPAALMVVDRWVARSSKAPLGAEWWAERYARIRDRSFTLGATMPGQFAALIGIVFIGSLLGWAIGLLQPDFSDLTGIGLLAIALPLIGFITVAFAGWTLLPRFEALQAATLALRVEVTDRERLARDLQELNDNLSQRTGELALMNEDLAAKSAQLESANRELAVSQHRSQLLTELIGLLQSVRDLDEAAQVLPAFLRPLFTANAGAVYIIKHSLNYLDTLAHWGDIPVALTFELSDCWGLRRGQPYFVEQTESALVCSHVSNHPSEHATVTTLCVPMMAESAAIGLLYLIYAKPMPDADTAASWLRHAQRVADQLGLALANLKLRKQLRDQSIRDMLTGLHNRRYLEESLPRELARAEREKYPVAVFMLDVDHFKSFNDNYGHEAGDAVLHALGRVLNESVRESDLACRFGGEEFTVALSKMTVDEARDWAERLLQRVRRMEVKASGQGLPAVTVSIGLAFAPEHGTDPETVIQAADLALYKAKREGRDRLVLYTTNSAATDSTSQGTP